MSIHEAMMLRALAEAVRARNENEVPVGAVVVHGEQIIGSAHNQREQLNDPTAHAEMIAITQAAAALDSWRLHECAYVCHLEPCPMCAGSESCKPAYRWSSTAPPIAKPAPPNSYTACSTTAAQTTALKSSAASGRTMRRAAVEVLSNAAQPGEKVARASEPVN